MVAQQLKSRSLSESDRWRSSDVTGQGLPVAIAILSADPSVRGRFEQLPQGDRTVTVAGVVRHVSDLRSLVGRKTINIAVMDNPTDRVTYGDLRMIRAEFEELMQLSIEAGTIKHPIAYEKYMDESFGRNAKPAVIAL